MAPRLLPSERHRRDVAEGRMSTPAVVEHVDVVGDGDDRGRARHVISASSVFSVPKKLSTTACPSSCPGAHAADDLFRTEQRSIVVAGVLARATRMTGERRAAPTRVQGPSQRLQHDASRQLLAHRVPTTSPGTKLKSTARWTQPSRVRRPRHQRCLMQHEVGGSRALLWSPPP